MLYRCGQESKSDKKAAKEINSYKSWQCFEQERCQYVVTVEILP